LTFVPHRRVGPSGALVTPAALGSVSCLIADNKIASVLIVSK
jgi:hypothetical protein